MCGEVEEVGREIVRMAGGVIVDGKTRHLEKEVNGRLDEGRKEKGSECWRLNKESA